MTIEKDKYDYTPYRAPNIMHKTKKGAAEQVPPGLEPQRMIAPLIDRLAKYHPDWMFVSLTGFADGGTGIPTATKYWVYQGMEYLGYIGLGTRDYQATIMLDGPRINAARRRGNGKQTGDVKKALKIVEEYFVGTTPAEKMRLTANQAANWAYNFYGDKQRAYSNSMEALRDVMLSYAIDNLPDFGEYAAKLGVSTDTVTTLPKVVTDREEALRMKGITGHIVITQGSNYVVQDIRENSLGLQIDTVSELPTEMQRKLGLLKLLEEKSVVPGIGVRMSRTEFFVMGEEA